MNITRHNYEEYFILYMDNELGIAERSQVEAFVQENPDLQEELDWLLQSRLVADASLVFENKDQLMKTPTALSINTTNYEEWLLLYTDNELTAEQKITVEKFVAAHPAIKEQFELLQKTRLEPEQDIIFHPKELLYRSEEKVRVIGINWRKIAVAASLLIAISTTALIVLNNNGDGGKGELASKGGQPGQLSTTTNAADQPPVATINANPVATDNNDIKTKQEATAINNFPRTNDKTVNIQRAKNKRPSDVLIKEDAPDIAANSSREDKLLAEIDVPEKKSLTYLNENTEAPVVTPGNSQSLNNVVAAASIEPIDPTDAEQTGKKNKFRGFFRKVTRTFEKTTNIKATDDEDRLLLGGLAIKL